MVPEVGGLARAEVRDASQTVVLSSEGNENDNVPKYSLECAGHHNG